MADDPKDQECGNCRFWMDKKKGYTARRGNCCRNPPTLVSHGQPFDDEDRESATQYPITLKDEWCGEWSPETPETFTEAAATLARFVLLGDRASVYALVDKLKEER